MLCEEPASCSILLWCGKRVVDDMLRDWMDEADWTEVSKVDREDC